MKIRNLLKCSIPVACVAVALSSTHQANGSSSPTLSASMTSANPTYVSYSGCYFWNDVVGHQDLVDFYYKCNSSCTNCVAQNYLGSVYGGELGHGRFCSGGLGGTFSLNCADGGTNVGYLCAWDETLQTWASADLGTQPDCNG